MNAPSPQTKLRLGPVSSALEAELRKQVLENQIVVWLDSDGRYASLAAALAEAREHDLLGYEVVSFGGSFLELMRTLAPMSSGVDKRALVVHVPGYHRTNVQSTPLLELVRAGTVHERKLSTLVRDAAATKATPDAIDALLAEPDLTLERADAWLAAKLTADKSAVLAEAALLSISEIYDRLRKQTEAGDRLASAPHDLHPHLEAELGLTGDWRERSLPPDPRTKDYAFLIAQWALCVEYVDDLRHPPHTDELVTLGKLPGAVTEACRTLATHLRTHHPDDYEQIARQTEVERMGAEIEVAHASDLGRIDTFAFEDAAVLREAFEALTAGDFRAAFDWAEQRIEGGSFWLERLPGRRSEWQLLLAAARLGLAIQAAGPKLGAKSLAEAADAYVKRGAAVDRAHRHLEQLREGVLVTEPERLDVVRTQLDAMREAWRTWADAWARDFNALCQAEGFLPDADLQQRTLFDQVVRPRAQTGPTAYFLVDALRYEMAGDLFDAIASGLGTDAKLSYRYAELPTDTSVGMNALTPLEKKGRLRPVFDAKRNRIAGLAASDFVVDGPERRRRAIHDRVGGPTCPSLKLKQVLERPLAQLKATVKKARVIVVHSEEIDKAGEEDIWPGQFEPALRTLKKVWSRLREAGVQHFVITADHGFLLLPDRAQHAKPHGRRIDTKRRHTLSTTPIDHSEEVRVPLRELGYEGVDELHLMCPATTSAFETIENHKPFVHGGNSLQERLIPVITLGHRVAAGANTGRFQIKATPLSPHADLHRLQVVIESVEQGSLDFAKPKSLELLLAVDLPGVRIESLQARAPARVEAGGIVAPLERVFQILFRLRGKTYDRAQVRLEPAGTSWAEGVDVQQRFDVAADGTKTAVPNEGQHTPIDADAAPEPEPALPEPSTTPEPAASEPPGMPAWLAQLPDDGTRAVFTHLASFGTVTEAEATNMLGNARKLRRFSLKFEEHAAVAPFSVRIESLGGVKTYKKESSK